MKFLDFHDNFVRYHRKMNDIYMYDLRHDGIESK